MRLSTLLDEIIPIPLDCEVEGLALNSRLVQKNDLFFAYPGHSQDGRRYIEEAIHKGASVVLAEENAHSFDKAIFNHFKTPIYLIKDLSKKLSEIAARFYHHPSHSQKVIGITGTNGKTSCSHFIASALTELKHACGVLGTLGNGLYGHLNPSLLTTPDPITLQKTLAQFQKAKAHYVAMEVSSHSLDQDRVNSIRFAMAIFTNLTRTHLDYHKTMEAYGAAKKKLFEMPALPIAIINYDDAFGQQLMKEIKPPKKIFAYGVTKPPHLSKDIPIIMAKDIQFDLTGVHASVITPWGEGELSTSLVGQFNISNLLAVLTTLCLLDIPFSDALASINKLLPVPGRMQVLGGQTLPLVIIDYAHTPDSLEKALTSIRPHCTGKLYCIFGAGGDRDRGMRPLMSAVVEQFADEICLTHDNIRTEDPQQILNDVLSGFKNPAAVKIEPDRAKAIEDIIQYAGAGDCVLVAGKGAETYQLVGNEKIPLNDLLEAKKALLNGEPYARLAQ